MKSGTKSTLEIAGGMATITLRRPSEHNRLDPENIGVKLRLFEQVRNDPTSRLLVLTGEGENTFGL